MTIRQMRLLDRYVGVVACWLLTGQRRVAALLRREAAPAEPRHILVIKLWGLGSVLLAGPALRALKQRFPEARLTFLTFPQNRTAVEMLGLADDIWTFQTRGLLRSLAWLSDYRRRCRREGVDVVLDLEFFSRATMVLSALSGAARRVGFWTQGIYRGDLLTDRCTYNPYRNMLAIFCAPGEKLGAQCDDLTYVRPQITAEQKAAARALLDQGGITGSPFVVLSPTVSDLGAELRRWPTERWAELADRLAADGDRVALVAAPADAEYIAEIVSATHHPDLICNLAGKTDLPGLAAVLDEASVLVACDSGPVHLAACLGTAVVVLFGTETPVLYGPVGPQHRIVYKAPYCSPCLTVFTGKEANFTCDRSCMLEITVDEVLAATREVLGHVG